MIHDAIHQPSLIDNGGTFLLIRRMTISLTKLENNPAYNKAKLLSNETSMFLLDSRRSVILRMPDCCVLNLAK
jgi:hypothetical protein